MVAENFLQKEKIFISLYFYYTRTTIIKLVDEFLSSEITVFAFIDVFEQITSDESRKKQFRRLLENSKTRNIVFSQITEPIIEGKVEHFQTLIERTESLTSEFISGFEEKINIDKDLGASLEGIDLCDKVPDEVKEISEEMKNKLGKIWFIYLEN